MLAFDISDMTCGGCVRSIRAAVARVAPTATVQADLATRRITVDGATDATAVAAAIAAAGFAATPLEAVVESAPRGSAGGCGRGGRCGCAGA